MMPEQKGFEGEDADELSFFSSPYHLVLSSFLFLFLKLGPGCTSILARDGTLDAASCYTNGIDGSFVFLLT